MKRIILAVLAALVLNFILSTGVDFALHAAGIFPAYGEPMFETGKVLLALLYRCAFIVLSGYVASVIAKEFARKATFILGIIGSLLWLAGAIALWNYAPPFYNVAGVIIGLPVTLLGYKLYQRKKLKYLRASIAEL